MRKIFLIIFVISISIIFTIGCGLTDSGKDRGGGDSGGGGSESTVINETATDGTGTVSGTINDDATVTLNQSDGTTQTAETSEDNPDYVFEDVPTGETEIIIDMNGDTTSQTIQVNTDEETKVNPFGSTQEMPDSLTVNVYEVTNKGWNTTVNDIQDTPLGEEFYAKEINIPTRSFEEGFPGVTDRFEWFGVVYEGKIKAPESGTYTFKVTCDDGAAIYIDGEMLNLVNPDVAWECEGVHPAKEYTGSVELTEGQIYDFKLKYFQGPRYHISLIVKIELPEGAETQLFNTENFK
jgi:hypothetical protein